MSAGFDPSDSLGDADDSGALVGLCVAIALCMATYHYHLKKRNESFDGRVGCDDQSRDVAGRDAGADGRQFGAGREEARMNGKAPRERSFWEWVKPNDLSLSSHGKISWQVLALFRALALFFCAVLWVFFARSKSCCSDAQYFAFWHNLLFTLYFLLALVASLKAKKAQRESALDVCELCARERATVCVFEVVLPTSMWVFVLYWSWVRYCSAAQFPTNSRAVNDVFSVLGLLFMLTEASLNRIVLSSRRWVFVSYLSCGYGLLLICVEKLWGDGHLAYREQGFLQLKMTSIPILVQLLMGHLVCHYLGCLLVTLRQRYWTTPLPIPDEGVNARVDEGVFEGVDAALHAAAGIDVDNTASDYAALGDDLDDLDRVDDRSSHSHSHSQPPHVGG